MVNKNIDYMKRVIIINYEVVEEDGRGLRSYISY